MKFLVYIFIFLFVKTSFAQNKDEVRVKASTESSQEIFTVVEEMPQFPGGPEAMRKFIQVNLIYPEEAEKNEWTGKTFLKFIINQSGNVTQVEILKSSGYTILDNEALRVIRLMPNWKPGVQNGKNVAVFFNLPLSFTLK